MASRPQKIAQRTPVIPLPVSNPERAQRKSIGNSFCPGDPVGLHGGSQALPSAPIAGPAEPALHLIKKQEKIPLVAKFPQSGQKGLPGNVDSSFSLYGFDQDRHRGFSDSGFDSCEIAERQVLETLQQGPESGFDFLLPGGRYPSHRAAVKRAFEGEDLVASGRAPEPSCELDQPLIRLGSAVAKKDLPRSGDFDQPFRQPGLRRGAVEIGRMDQCGRLAGNGRCDFRMRMPERTDRDSGSKIQVFAPVEIPDPAA